MTDFFPPSAGGVERVCGDLAAELSRAGCDVKVLVPQPANAGDLPVPERVDVHRFPVRRTSTVAHFGSMLAAGREAAERLLADWAPDVIHSHLTLSTLPVLGAAANRGIPVVATFYGPWFLEYRFQVRRLAASRLPRRLAVEAVSPWIAACMRLAQERVLTTSRAVIVLSRHSRNELGELGWLPAGGRPVVIPGGFDPTRFAPARDRAAVRSSLGLPGTGRMLFSVRRLVPRMGLENLLHAFAALSRRAGRLFLVIGGDGPLRPVLHRMAADLGLGDSVLIPGAIPDRALPRYYAAADLLVMPTVALEGFGLPIIEGWACGLPAVGTPAAAVGELIASMDPSLVARSASPSDLADAIGAALEREPGSLASLCLDRARPYAWPVLAKRYLHVYDGVVQQPLKLDPADPERRQ